MHFVENYGVFRVDFWSVIGYNYGVKSGVFWSDVYINLERKGHNFGVPNIDYRVIHINFVDNMWTACG